MRLNQDNRPANCRPWSTPAEYPHRPLLIFLGVTGFDGKGVDEAEDYKPITGKAKIVSLGHSAMRAAA